MLVFCSMNEAMKERLRRYYLRKAAGLPVCNWTKMTPEELERFDALNSVFADPILTEAIGAPIE